MLIRLRCNGQVDVASQGRDAKSDEMKKSGHYEYSYLLDMDMAAPPIPFGKPLRDTIDAILKLGIGADAGNIQISRDPQTKLVTVKFTTPRTVYDYQSKSYIDLCLFEYYAFDVYWSLIDRKDISRGTDTVVWESDTYRIGYNFVDADGGPVDDDDTENTDDDEAE